ncbi:MAG: carboxypeptidase-like regulatory domain-containing protein, partial [Longimicrobiales bacterium]
MLSDWRRAPRRGLLVIAMAVLAFEPLQGQTLTTGALGGRILDETGASVLEALVTVREVTAGLVHETDTGRRGVFSFVFLAPGEYELTVEQIGFAPRRVTDIHVRQGRNQQMTITLRAAASSGVQQEVERFHGAVAPASLYGGSQWLPAFALRSVPGANREAGDVLRMASIADDRWSVEGLPASLSVLLLDGTEFRPAAHPQLGDEGPAAAPFALTGIESAELVTNGVAVDWSGAAASFLSAQSRRGAAGTAVHAAAFWSGDALPSSSSTGSLSHNDLQGGVVVRGPLFGDGNRFSIGVEASRLETPLSAAWGDTDAAAALAAGDTLGLNLDSYRESTLVSGDALAAFARADWSAGQRHRVELSAHFAARPNAAAVDASGSQLPYEANDLVAGGALRSRLSADIANEVRVGVTRSVRERNAIARVTPTRLVSEDLGFGAATVAASSADELILRIREALHLPYGTHAIEIGGAAAVGSY